MKSKAPLSTVAVVDGECEQWYLNMIKRNERVNFKITPEIPQRKKIVDQYETVKAFVDQGYERVFWIVDFDTIMKEDKESKKGESPLKTFLSYYSSTFKNEKVVVIINNPCLEFWYLLHFKKTSKYYESYEKLLPSLKKWMPDYEKTRNYYTKQNNDIYLKLKPLLMKAIENANALDEFEPDNPQKGLSQMQRLFMEKIGGNKLIGNIDE